eukprot:TRINITY_DN31865_c1_g1_i1.p2 TRINITY_DN31865_c1_g1~~TRINITY_DN31865_c1_g1_i1.p2  ORF type:complete len:102 (+),score=0.91 TRINITY_DN31865_c1_g1_i1:103-408(+)
MLSKRQQVMTQTTNLTQFIALVLVSFYSFEFFLITVLKIKLGLIQTTNELKIPTANTNKTHSPRPEKTVPLFSDQLLGDANTTGTPTTKRKETEIKANNNN